VQPIISINNLCKTYSSGFKALKDINLTINQGEIFALLGPNGAGKTTLISSICGIVTPSSGLFGKPSSPSHIEKTLRQLSLWEKKDSKIMTLSGGMKRRLMIAKALSHEPQVLFLDEPTAGVDVELRKDMWQVVRGLKENGVTIILTTHYIEEAEEMADRIGVINKGEIILVEEKDQLMQKLGKRQLTLHLHQSIASIPDALNKYSLELSDNGYQLIYSFDAQDEQTNIAELLRELNHHKIDFKDLNTQESSLEDIFVSLVKEQ